jgi:membrane fusion protein, multidrug efflux system
MATERRDSFFMFYVIAFVFVAVAAGGVYFFWTGKQKRLEEEGKARAAVVEQGPLITTAVSARGPDFRKVSLLGEARPFKTATLYAKVSGYLSRIAVDAGDRVKAGQFIAEINSPELDAQYRGAAAALENRRKLAERTRDLAEKGFFSQQALDNAETDVRTQEDVAKEIRTMQNYRRLVAPFDGVVTTRYVDPGALVTNATSNQTSAQPVVTISDPSKLRVTVYVDQADAAFIKPGTKVEIADSSNPTVKAEATVSRTSGELDPRTRTMATQVDFDNSKGTFISGSFVSVSLLIPAKSFIEVPSAALVTREGKTYVAAVGDDKRVKLTPIEVAGTDGKTLRVASGISEGVRVALSLPNTVSDGARVNPAPPPPGAAPATAAGPAALPPAAGAAPAVPPSPATAATAASPASQATGQQRSSPSGDQAGSPPKR